MFFCRIVYLDGHHTLEMVERLLFHNACRTFNWSNFVRSIAWIVKLRITMLSCDEGEVDHRLISMTMNIASVASVLVYFLGLSLYI